MKKLIPFIALLTLLLALVSCNDLLPIDSESTDTGTVDTGDKPTPDDDFLLKLDELKKKNTGSTVGEADRSWQYYSHYKYVNVFPNEDFKLPEVSYAVKYSDKEISAGVKEINYAVGSYKIFYTYDEYARSAYADKGDISIDMLGQGSGRAVVCIERKYDYTYGDEVALRNLAVIDGKTCIVLDRIGKGVTSSEPVTRVDFIYLDNSLDVLKEAKPEGEIIVVDNVIETDATYDLCYELANKLDGDYYNQFDAVMSDELKTSMSSIETKEEFIPTKYWKRAGYWHGGVLTADYDVISNAGELLRFADNALRINTSVFEDNVILLIRRREGSEWGENVGFKNLTVKDGEVYIVLDRYGDDLSSPLERTYADFLIIPKDRIPDTVTKQGKIKVISNDFWIRDDETWDVIHDKLRKENTEQDKLTEEVERPWTLYNYYDYINTYAKDSYKMPEVPYAVKYFDKEISEGIRKIDYAVGSYDIFYSYEDYEKSAYADITPTGSDPFANEGDAVMCIKITYDYTYGEEIAFRNLSLIEGKVCIVLDRVGTEPASSEPVTRVEFINLKKSDIPDRILKRGEITVVDNLIETEEDIDFYRELAKGSGGYYEKLDSEAKAEIFGAIHDTEMRTVSLPINYMKYYGDWAGYILNADYVTVSSVEELSALVSDTSGIDASIFDENVVLCLKRHYGSPIEHEAGFKNLTVKDGELYIAVDAKVSNRTEESCEAYVDFIVIPKDEIPDTVSKEGKINVVSNETDYFDEEILQSYYESLKKRDPGPDYIIGVEPGKEWLYYRHYDYVNTLPKKELDLPTVSYSVKYFDKEISEGVSEINYAVGSYKIFYSYEEFSKSVYADMDYDWVSIKYDLENGHGAVICIERKYDYSYGQEMAFRNLAVIDGKVCIVLDRMDTETISSEPVTYVDFLHLESLRYIPEGTAPEGEIFIIDNRIETDELTDLCRELANKSDGEYYLQFEGEMTSELNSAIHKLSAKKKEIPMQSWKHAICWQGGIFSGKYEIVSSVEELSKLARDADKIDPSIFDDNVILCVERHENVVWGENIGFKNLTVKDGEIYIVLDRYCGDNAGDACWSYADFIIMPKDKIPEIMGTEGNINIISNDFYILDDKALELKYEELKNSAWSDYYKIAGYHNNSDLKDVIDAIHADLTGTLRDVPITIESDRTIGEYRAFNTYEQYEKAFKLEYKYQECNESIKPFFDDNVLVYIVGKYDPNDGGIEGFRNITWRIEDGATIVLDRNKCIRYYGDKNELCGIYIWVPRDEIDGYVNGSGRITILYDQTVPDEEIEYYRDLASKSGQYYENFEGDATKAYENGNIVNYFAPLKYSMTYNIWYGRLTVTNYKIISDYASLSEYTVKGEIDETVFENNVLLYVERCYSSINGSDLGFRNFEVKDGQLYIVVDRAEGLMESDALDPHADFIVIPKEKLPEGVASEGTIKVINSIQ